MSLHDAIKCIRLMRAEIRQIDEVRGDDTPLSLAARCDYRQYAWHLIDGGADPDLCCPLCKTGDAQIMEWLIGAGAHPNVHHGSLRKTPLHMAVHRGRHDLVRLLLCGGADPNATDYRGATALSYCTDVATAQLLVEHGADVQVSDVPRRAVFNHELMHYLLGCGADARRALSTAVKFGDADMIDLVQSEEYDLRSAH